MVKYITNITIKGLTAFTTILATAACAFAGVTHETKLDNVNWNQVNPWEDFLPKGETANTSAGCVPTAYAQLMAYHEWPAIVDDTVIGHGALSPESGTYIYRQDFSTPVYTKVDWNAMKNDRFSPRGEFECGRLMAIVGAYSFPVYAVGGTASTVTCPHFNPWYSDFVYYTNPLSSEDDWEKARKELFAAVKNSIEAKLPLCAGFQSSQGPHAIVIQGYHEKDGVPEAFCNLGWGGASNDWTSYNTNPSGKSYALTGIFANHAPRKMVQIEPLPAVSGMNLTLKWYAPKYWKELAPEGKRITGYQVEIAELNDTIVDWTDDFGKLKQTYHLKSMCDGGATTEGGVTHMKDVIKIEKVDGGNQLWLYNCPDPRYYEWPETWIATDSSKLDFKGLVEYTENMDGLLQVKVANGPWTTLYDLTEGGKTDRSAGEWKDYQISLAELAEKPFKLRLYVARRMRGEFNHWSWKFKNWTLKSVKTFGKPSVSKVAASQDTFSTFQMPGTYEFSVKPIIEGVAEECYRTVVTMVQSGAPSANSINVTYRGNAPTDELKFTCAHSDPSVLTVTTTRAVEKLLAISGNTAIYPDEAISVKRESDTTWKVTLTPTDLFKLYKKYSDGQKLILTLVAIDANGTATYKDLSLTFSTDANDPTSPSGGETGSVSFTERDFYLPEAGEDEWIFTLDNSFKDSFWDAMTFKRGSETCKGANLPFDAKVRIVVTATRPTAEYPNYNRIRFENHRTISVLSVISASESAPALTFYTYDGMHDLNLQRLNVQGLEVINEGGHLVTPDYWIGYNGRVSVADVYLEKTKTISGVGTLNLRDGSSTFKKLNTTKFKGYVSGSCTQAPAVEPDPGLIGEGGDDVGGSTGDDISTNAQDPVNSLYRTYGYDMTEDFWDARKEAIQKKKLLFVLSGSTSCNWCHETMKYLERMSDKIDAGYVCYYAKRQNGNVPMIGGLPQYGTYDPRTIDAFTGTIDTNGNFNPEAAWYSHCDNAFDSGRGFSEIKIDQCLNAAEGHTVGKFEKFTLEGPSAVFADTPTKLQLVAHFDDGVKMDVDHGVEWKVISGSATITAEGVVTVKSGEVVVQARNAFYNFNATENTSTTTLKTIGIDEVSELNIVSESFNLEDDTTVRLRAEAVLKDGTKTTAFPVWTATIKEFTPLTDDIPLHEMKSGEITLDPKENGLVHYRYSAVDKSDFDGINLQDHVYHVTASLGSLKVEKDIPVYGPTRVWPYEWEIVTPKDVAPGSVIRVKVNKLRYTYGGKVYETTDTTMAEFETGYAQNYNGYYLDRMTSADIPVTINNTREDSLPVRVTARKKGGKYAYYAFNKDEEASRKWVKFHPAGTYVTSTSGIRLNTGWLNIYFPDRTDYDTLVNEDSDKDGFTNAEEFLLGTDPSKAEDRWAFTSSHFDWPNEVYYRVMFMSHQFPGRDYTIEGAQSVNGPWFVLGKANGKLPGVLTDENVTAADQCRIFRVKVKFSDLLDSYETAEFTIHGYGVWNGVSLNPKEDEKYAAFIVDANNLTYSIPVTFSKTQNLASPVFSVPTEQVMPGTLDRFEPAESFKSEGYRFVRKEKGIWTEYYAVKGVQSWEEVSVATDVDAIPGLKSADASALKKAACAPTKLSEWARGCGKVTLGSDINLDCFLLNVPNAARAPELKIEADDLKAILSNNLDSIKAKYPNAKVELVPVDTLPDTPNAKFRRLKISP
ncbi:MAG: C10 family peptidase [Kiritimatiellae bacterium]|nr:C10 family peptidase [Kiritimatiellia bacterium]